MFSKKKIPFSADFAFASIMLLGALLRLVLLGSVPGGMHQDEALTAWTARSLYFTGMDSAGNVWPVYLAGWGDGQSALYAWLTIPFYVISGGRFYACLTRLPQAIVGILTIWAVYEILKMCKNERFALIGAAALSICPWHVMMCRWGLEANLAPGFLMFGLVFFLKSLYGERHRNAALILSGICYGLSLYCYAVIWPLVPFILLCQYALAFGSKRLNFTRYFVIHVVIIGVLALPLMLFLAVNTLGLEPIRLPFMTIPVMSGFRGGEVASGLSALRDNLDRAWKLFRYQNTGTVYAILRPYGLFYNPGRVFILIGIVGLVVRLVRSICKKTFAAEWFLFIQLFFGVVNCALVKANVQQVNTCFIPLVLCEAYGIYDVCYLVVKVIESLAVKYCAGVKLAQLRSIANTVIYGIVGLVFAILLVSFQRDYYSSYRELISAYFYEGLEDSVETAMEKGRTIYFERGAQWPNILLYSGTVATEYLENIEYKENGVEPYSFTKGEYTFYDGIDYDNIKRDAVYIIYFDHISDFEKDFEIVRFGDWCVAY